MVGYAWAIPVAIGLCSMAGGYFLLRLGHVQPYPVQVRVAYLGLLLYGLLPGMNWIYWVPLFGTTAINSRRTPIECSLASGSSVPSTDLEHNHAHAH